MLMHCHSETLVDTPPYIELLPVETVPTLFYYEGDEENNELCDDRGDPTVLATVTIASLIGTSIGEAQQTCPEIGPGITMH